MRSTSKVFNNLALSTILLASLGAKAELQSFVPAGGSCMSQSSWTQKALEQTDVIATTLQAMQKDPNCRSVVEAIGGGKLFGQTGEVQGVEETYNAETLMQELAALRDVLMQKKNTAIAGQLNPAIAEATVDVMGAIAADNATSARDAKLKTLKARLKNTTAQGVQILTNLFQVLPQQQQCLDKRPDLSAALVMGGIRVASAFAMGDMGMSLEMANMASNFLSYLQDSKFTKVQKTLNQQKLWSDLSCLTETAQTSFCAVKDGFELMKIQTNFLNRNYVNTPIEGFYLMSREVVTISDWIEKIRTSVDQKRNRTIEQDEVLGGTDDIQLTDEAVVGTTESVRTAFMNINSYMHRLYDRLQNRADSQSFRLSLADTISRVTKVLNKFKELDAAAQDIKLSGYSDELRAEHAAKFTSLIATVYQEFNVKSQDSSFFSGRMTTYVSQEYNVRLENENFAGYTNQLLASARGTVADKLKEYKSFNVAQAEADLNQASTIHMANLNVVERIVSSHMADYIASLNRISGHRGCETRTGMAAFLPDRLIWGNCVFFPSKQDTNNEAENTRAKVCIQTLGFKQYKSFKGLCEGAVLKSNQISNGRSVKGLQLEYNYDQLYKQRVAGENKMNKLFGTVPENRFSQVCLLRDYFRNNFVHWLTTRQAQK